MQEQKIHTVSELTQRIKRSLENGFPYVYVKGEITDLTRANSGHIYFSLKDENSLLPCAWFKNSQKTLTSDPLTGEVFDTPKPSLAQSLKQGMEMIFTGSLNVYAPRGAYQFLVSSAEEVGKGNLHKAFEELKAKLFKLGWFDEKYKKPLPFNPKNIAVLTSPQGAVIHDFCRIATNFSLGANIRIYPIAVQGAEAVPSIVNAFNRVHADNWAEVIVLIRGGGSLEDLWAFNEEAVAKSIFEASIPVITGIGHQPDVSIAEFVADVSAATPSHVVPHLWQEKLAYIQGLDEMEKLLSNALDNFLQKKQSSLTTLREKLNLLSPQHKIKMQENLFNSILGRFLSCSNIFTKKEERLQQEIKHFLPLLENLLTDKLKKVENSKNLLEAHNPYKPLEKGYALVHEIAENNQEKLINSVSSIQENKEIYLEFHNGKVKLNPQQVTQIK